MDFIQQYFIEPIWNRAGYNVVNTVVYAAIALISAYVMYRILKKEGIRIDTAFILSIIPFILLGSTIRSIVDTVDRGAMAENGRALFGLLGAVYNSHIYDYGYLTVTPGIYVVIGLLTFLSILIANRLKKPLLAPIFGAILWVFHIILLIPMLRYWFYGVLVLMLAVIGGAVGYFHLKRSGARVFSSIAVFSHALDGAATYVTIDIWNRFEATCLVIGSCYGEQHVVSNVIGDIGNVFFAPIGGFFLFYLIKVGFSALAVQIVEKDSNGEEREFILLLLIIFGLAPGVRDLLTLLVGA